MNHWGFVENRVVLVTGAAGTIGSTLCHSLAPRVKALRCFDHSENDLFFLQRSLARYPRNSPLLGDVRDLDRLRFAISVRDTTSVLMLGLIGAVFSCDLIVFFDPRYRFCGAPAFVVMAAIAADALLERWARRKLAPQTEPTQTSLPT